MSGNYLRVRGEYSATFAKTGTEGELPPRARRIPLNKAEDKLAKGTTSACAENTQHWRLCLVLTRNYLRVRGEYCNSHLRSMTSKELPPRARRIRDNIPGAQVEMGTTSACAENTPFSGRRTVRHRNYLRVRGEYIYG